MQDFFALNSPNEFITTAQNDSSVSLNKTHTDSN